MNNNLDKYLKLHEQQLELGISANAFAEKIGMKKSTYYGGLSRCGLTPTSKKKKNVEPTVKNVDVKKQKMKNLLKKIDPKPIRHTIQIPECVPERKKEMSVVVIKGDSDDVLKVLQQMF